MASFFPFLCFQFISPLCRLSNKKKDRKWHIKTTSEKAQLVTQRYSIISSLHYC
jgi:hypothetical protein